MYRETIYPNLIQRVSDGAFIPKVATNLDYQNYLKWESLPGNELLPVEE